MKQFHPNSSIVTDDSFAQWMTSPIESDIVSVPGIGPKTKQKMEENGVTTTHQLFGKFLSLKHNGSTVIEHGDLFYKWLDAINVQSVRRAGIVKCVGSKLDIFFPGVYSDSDFTNVKRICEQFEKSSKKMNHLPKIQEEVEVKEVKTITSKICMFLYRVFYICTIIGFIAFYKIHFEVSL